MRVYDPTQPLISLHVPKTAGTSLRHVLRKWYPNNLLKLHYQDTASLRYPQHNEFHGGICIHGHFDAARGYGVNHYYPNATQFIVFLRDPFERAISLYHFIRKHHAGQRKGIFKHFACRNKFDEFMSFDRWIPFLLEEQAEGRSTAYPWQFPDAPDIAAIKEAMRNRFVFVGITEFYSESLSCLAEILGKPLARERFLNCTPRTRQDFSHWRDIHQKSFPEEYEIYETALRLNASYTRDRRGGRPYVPR